MGALGGAVGLTGGETGGRTQFRWLMRCSVCVPVPTRSTVADCPLGTFRNPPNNPNHVAIPNDRDRRYRPQGLTRKMHALAAARPR